MHGDPSEQHQGERGSRPGQARVGQNLTGKVRIQITEALLDTVPAASPAPGEDPQQASAGHDGQCLQRVCRDHRPQAPAGRVPGRQRGEPDHQPPRRTSPAREQAQQQEQRIGHVPHDVSSLLDLDQRSQQPDARTEPCLEVLRVSEEPGTVDRDQDRAGQQQPSDRQA